VNADFFNLKKSVELIIQKYAIKGRFGDGRKLKMTEQFAYGISYNLKLKRPLAYFWSCECEIEKSSFDKLKKYVLR